MTDIKSMLPEELAEYMVTIGQPKYRANQIFRWLHTVGVGFDGMTDISKSLRDKLKESCFVPDVSVAAKQVSAIDGTVKYLFRLYDDEYIESVFMRYHHGNTLCISTQAGCRMGCKFCASTLKGLKRNLLAAEMISQIQAAEKDTGERVSGVVLMGMGEPLDNYDNVLKFLRLVNHPKGLNIGHRHISLSTCGLVNNIRRLAEEKLQITLSVSLHAPNDELRQSIMPIANKYSVDELLQACRDYEKITGRRTSFEYALISGVTDTTALADELGKKLKGSLCHVNLIPVNEIKERSYKTASRAAAAAFIKVLEGYGITATVRRKLGSDISAACGQLRDEHESLVN
ncbi:MAG: 23S rRNA (adenine(2503)-C(2))-methyltransferase RlmN [Clostridia bacterium]|nr:23S rRNA (adenine(2503)-C(2))-methyltransferase RlmN [Clostridia bacterium]